MNIIIGCDHTAIAIKEHIRSYLISTGINVIDSGAYSSESCDYPDIAREVCERIVNGEAEKGILICGTGIGMSMAANKIKGIRAAVCSEHYSAKYTRLHNNANVLCLGARVTGPELAAELAEVFLNTEFEGGRHLARVKKIDDLEKN